MTQGLGDKVVDALTAVQGKQDATKGVNTALDAMADAGVSGETLGAFLDGMVGALRAREAGK